MRSYEAENATAVKAAMMPARKKSATDLIAAIDAVKSAIDNINATGAALTGAGISAVTVPAPYFDGVKAMAQSIMNAAQPELEKR